MVKTSRLRRNKTASLSVFLDSFSTKCGFIDLSARLVNNKPYYSITNQIDFDYVSYYDGPDFETAFDLFLDMAIAFKGVPYSEKLSKKKDSLRISAEKMIIEYARIDESYLKKKPLFLGLNDF